MSGSILVFTTSGSTLVSRTIRDGIRWRERNY